MGAREGHGWKPGAAVRGINVTRGAGGQGRYLVE